MCKYNKRKKIKYFRPNSYIYFVMRNIFHQLIGIIGRAILKFLVPYLLYFCVPQLLYPHQSSIFTIFICYLRFLSF